MVVWATHGWFHHVIVRHAATGAAVGLCERVVRPAYIGSEVEDLPYLGALRIVPSHRHRIAILKETEAPVMEAAGTVIRNLGASGRG